MISGLEHYRESAEVLESWWKIKREYQKCIRNLKYHKVAFEENLEELLLPLIADEDKLQQLLNNPGRLNFIGDFEDIRQAWVSRLRPILGEMGVQKKQDDDGDCIHYFGYISHLRCSSMAGVRNSPSG
jgi:hypothetical protein